MNKSSRYCTINRSFDRWEQRSVLTCPLLLRYSVELSGVLYCGTVLYCIVLCRRLRKVNVCCLCSLGTVCRVPAQATVRFARSYPPLCEACGRTGSGENTICGWILSSGAYRSALFVLHTNVDVVIVVRGICHRTINATRARAMVNSYHSNRRGSAY